MKSIKVLLVVLFVALLSFAVPALALDTSAAVKITNTGDPCQNPNVVKSSAIVSAATGTTSVITQSTGKAIYICYAHVTPTGTSPDIKFVSGSTASTACDTGPIADLTGVMKPLTGTALNIGYGGTVAKTAVTKAVCAVMSAATTAATGVITYVQQ